MGKSPRRKKQSTGFLGKLIIAFLIIITIVFAWLIVTSIFPFGREKPTTVVEPTEEETSEQEPSTQETTEETSQETTEETTETTEETSEETTEEVTTTEETQEKPAEITIPVYFSDDQAQYMIGEYRTISNDDPVTNAVNELLKGPNSADLYALIPEGTKLLNAEIKNSVAYVDFSTDILKGATGGSTLQRFIIYTTVNTVTGIDEVDAVQILIGGKNVGTFGDFDISEPLYRDINMIR